ncbi:putative NRPS-like protein biosynthetic cluster [Arachnomyces sp. PD_36]|nr:putative NRPS-like protein biosynthetic cluster [Arachnomyces sp. PD_36]
MDTTVMASATTTLHQESKNQPVVTNSVTVPTPPVSPDLSPRTISELISFRAKQFPDDPIFGYPSQGIEYVEYTHSQLDRFSKAGASQYVGKLPLRQTSNEKERVIAMLGASTLEYLITAISLSRLGFTVLFLSTRIADAAYTSLLEVTCCSHILVDASFQKTASNLQQRISNLEVLEILHREQFVRDDDVQLETTQELNPVQEASRNSWIIHSSGSTGLPKPIYQTHSAALRNYENSMEMKGFITLPLFHAHGLGSVFRGITANKKIFMYNASLPLTEPNLLEIMRKHKFEIFYGVPYVLKLLSESNEGIEALAAMQVVMFGGSACPDVLGDLLTEAGVNLVSHYGTTETGQLATSFRPGGDKGWNYVRVHDRLEPYVRFEGKGGGLFELVVLEGWPSKVATNRDDGSYATKDLFEPHPTINKAWKFCGRLDDTIVLVNGEKAIPLAMEGVVRQQKLVRDAVMFGSGKSQLGMMVIASDAAAGMSESAVINEIWPVIEEENRNSPAYAHLSRETLVVLPTGTPYAQTDKGTLIRQAFYRAKADEIEEVYRRLEEASSNGTSVLGPEDTRAFLRDELLKIVPELTQVDISNDTDLFSLGVDSLQSTRLRGAIRQHLQLNGRSLSQNFVFENPTLAKMADAIINVRDGESTRRRDVEQEMTELLAKYSNFPQHIPQPRVSARSCVVVTGATGSLGAHVVAKLVTRKDVDEVCCLVRANSERTARQRVIKSLKHRAALHSLPIEAQRKITAYPADFSQSGLGLPEGKYERLTENLTYLIHCAWSVNFNKQLSSFETDCIAGAKNLMLLCLSAKQEKPASFNFCSSVSTVANTPGETVPEDLPESFACAQRMGYAQSKLVTEALCARAVSETGMDARVLRVGQIVADTVQGIWNDTEAIPLMLQAASTMGALPTLDESPRWLPVDYVAETVLDISLSPDSPQAFFNIVNPATFHWTKDLLPALKAAGLRFEEVDQREWIRRLRSSNPDPGANPTIKLLEFFAGKYDRDTNEKRRAIGYGTSATEKLSPILASRPETGQNISFVRKFVNHFLSTSWAPSLREDAIPPPKRARLLILAGPCGSGKSTMASLVAEHLHCDIPPHVIEGDNAHDAIAVSKMRAGIPLSPIDREIWVSRLKIQILERIRAAELIIDQPSSAPTCSTTENATTILLACSALQRNHRDALRNLLSDGSIETRFALLQATAEELENRVKGRNGHYMKSHMIQSQLMSLEDPGVDEVDVVPVDTGSRTPTETAEDIIDMLEWERS